MISTLLCFAAFLFLSVRGDEVHVLFKDSAVVFEMPTPYTHHRAELWCNYVGLSGLVSIHNEAVNDEIKDALVEFGITDAWIGVHSDGADWKFDDGSAFNFERWAGSNGDSGAASTQRAMIDENGEWYEKARNDELTGIVCEGSSIAVHVDSTKTWDEATAECESEYPGRGRLTTIHASARDSLIGNVLTKWEDSPKKAWIGYKDDKDEDHFYWVDGSPDTHTNWAGTAEPNNAGSGGEQCTEVYSSGQWNDQACTDSIFYVCSTPIAHANSVVTPKFRVTSWYGHFNESEDYCDTFDTHVATITSDDDNDAIQRAAKGLGLDRVWIGYYAESPQVWDWKDGSDTTYENWGHAQPVAHEHAQMIVSSGKWENVVGGVDSMSKVGVVCNRATKSSSPLKLKKDSPIATANSPLVGSAQMIAGVVALSLAIVYCAYYRNSGGVKKIQESLTHSSYNSI